MPKQLISSILIILKNVRQALIIFGTFFLLTSIYILILGLNVFFQSGSSKLKQQKKDVHNELLSCFDAKVPEMYPRTKVMEEKYALHRYELSARELSLGFLKKNMIKYQQLYQFCLVNNLSKYVIKKALGPSKRSLKNF